MEAILFSEKSVIIRATRRNIPEDGILQFISRFIAAANLIYSQTPTFAAFPRSLTQVEISTYCCLDARFSIIFFTTQ
jgi:hypothetical protein